MDDDHCLWYNGARSGDYNNLAFDTADLAISVAMIWLNMLRESGIELTKKIKKLSIWTSGLLKLIETTCQTLKSLEI